MITKNKLKTIIFFFIIIFFFLEFVYPKLFKFDIKVYRYWGDRPVSFFPNSNLRAISSNYDTKFKTNSLGFNDYEVNNEIDILILGDSFVEGIQIDRNYHFSEVIKKNFTNLKINKMGMSGYGNAQFFLNYIYFYEKYNPKIIIIINASNDVTDNFCDINNKNCSSFDNLLKIKSTKMLEDQIKILKINNRNLEYEFIDTKKNELKFFNYIIRHYISKFKAYYSIKDIKKKIFSKNNFEKAATNTNSLKQYHVHNLFLNKNYVLNYYYQINNLIYKTIVEKHKKKLLFVTVNKDLNENLNNVTKHTQDLIAEHMEKMKYDHLYLNPIMIENYKKYNELPNWDDDKHWNKFGHEIVGQAITDVLIQKNWLN